MTDFVGTRIALLTQHGKERVIAPVLEPALQCQVVLVQGYDTDQLGTFTREIPRLGTQLEAARRKARIGMELSGLPVGLASEGSFGPDPHTGLFPWNVELLVLIDDRSGLELVGMAQGPARSSHLLTHDWAALEAFARKAGFPEQQLVLRPQDEHGTPVHKGLADWAKLRECFDHCLTLATNSQVFAEADLRAHANPTRMQQIGLAAQDLLRRLQSACPACGQPGWATVAREPGLPCADCGSPTQMYQAEVWACPSCQHRAVVPRTDRLSADPQHCGHCNP